MQLELAEPRGAERVARVHVRFDHPEPAKQPLRAGIGLVAEAAAELLGIVDVGIEQAGQHELAARVDDLGVGERWRRPRAVLPTAAIRPPWIATAPSRMIRRSLSTVIR